MLLNPLLGIAKSVRRNAESSYPKYIQNEQVRFDMNKPKFKINLTTVDYIVEIIGIIGIICLILLPLYYFNDLPNKVPKHFNVFGQPDSYGNKVMIWVIPIIALLLYIGMTILNKYPHIFNYPTKVTNENAEKLYKIATKSIRFLKVVIVVLFSYLNFRIIKTSLNETTGIGYIFLPVFVILIIGTIGFMIYEIMKK